MLNLGLNKIRLDWCPFCDVMLNRFGDVMLITRKILSLLSSSIWYISGWMGDRCDAKLRSKQNTFGLVTVSCPIW